jgi:glycosyltransferase involved in cell wall biosynthesis
MRLLMVAAASSVHAMRWANAFVARGHAVHLATQHHPVVGFDGRVTLHRLDHRMGLGYLFNRPALSRLIHRISPDAVNAHYASGYGTLSNVPSPAPLVLNVWGSDVYEFPETSPVHRALIRRNLRHADQVVSTSEVMARRTLALCPGLKQLDVVPFGVDVERFRPASHAPSGLVFGTVKTLAPKYGIDTLIRAFALLRNRAPALQARLRIVGGGPDGAALQQLASQLGIASQVDFIGAVAHDKVPDELRRMHVYAALSRTHSETFGVAVVEASACGLPVVVADVGGLPEVVEKDVTGLIVPPDDPESAAGALERLAASAEARMRMGEAGRLRVQRLYAWDHCVDLMLGVIERAIERKRA